MYIYVFNFTVLATNSLASNGKTDSCACMYFMYTYMHVYIYINICIYKYVYIRIQLYSACDQLSSIQRKD